MARFNVTVAIFLVCITFLATEASSDYYSFARVESCKGCRLKSLPDVKKFIFEDVPLYKNVEFQHIQGAPPELVLFDNNKEEVERLKLAQLSREECNELLASKGFEKMPPVKDEI